MFEAIIRHFYLRGAFNLRDAEYLRQVFVNFILKSEWDFLPEQLTSILQKNNFETLQSYEEIGILFAYHMANPYRTTSVIGSNSNNNPLQNQEDTIVFRNWDELHEPPTDEHRVQFQKTYSAFRIELEKIPISQQGRCFSNRSDLEEHLFIAWFCWNWQKIDGFRCGLKANLVECAALLGVSLVDFLPDFLSNFYELESKPQTSPVPAFFPRSLTFEEIFIRTSIKNFWLNPFQNYWRYFEKDGRFKEIGAWDSATGIREGDFSEKMTASVGQIVQHENSKTALRRLTDFTNQTIFDGWEEKLRPVGLPEKLHERAFDFGHAHFSEEPKKRPKKEEIEAFEKRRGLKFPPVFEVFFEHFSGKTPRFQAFYPINDLYTVKVERFYSLAELDDFAAGAMEKTGHFLPIAALENDEFLALAVDEKRADFGRVAIVRKSGAVEVCDYSFEKMARWAQSDPVQPEIFAAQENDAAFLKKRLAEGWQPATVYRYQRAVEVAAEHDALEVLLQAGERIRNDDYRQATWVYDAKTMSILDKYR